MKRVLIGLSLAVLLVVGLALPAAATTVTFNLGELQDLPHEKWVKWGKIYDFGTSYIVSARLIFEDIYEWSGENNYRLFVTLLDNPSPASTAGSKTWGNDDQSAFADHFGSVGHHLVTFSPDGDWKIPVGEASKHDVEYPFSAVDLTYLRSYATNDVFGLGIDPDCHFYNDGITLTVETAPVPEPATLLLVGGGLLGLAGLRRRFRK